jgi:hypothetical protein
MRQARVSCDPGCRWLCAYVPQGAMAQQAVIAPMFVPISTIAYSTLAEGATESIKFSIARDLDSGSRRCRHSAIIVEDASSHPAPHSGSIGGRCSNRAVHDLHPRAGCRRDGQFRPLPETQRPRGHQLLDRFCDRRTSRNLRFQRPPLGDRLVGGPVSHLRRVRGFRRRLLPFGGQLHDVGLRGHHPDAVMEIARTIGSGQRGTAVRRLGRDSVHRHTAPDASEVPRPARLMLAIAVHPAPLVLGKAQAPAA